MLLDILIFLAVIGIMVFVHELGHFLAAKACNVYVDRFSIGIGRIFGVKLGETDYCIGALPIGGYVKMAGQEDKPLSDEERQRDYGNVPPERWFNHRPVWQRAIIIVAGPLMNIVLGWVIYAAMVGVGGEIPDYEMTTRIGKIEPDSAAATAPLYRYDPEKPWAEYTGTPDAVGWKTGDIILALDGKRIDSMSDLAVDAVLNSASVRYVLLERTESDGTKTQYMSPVQPKIVKDEPYPRFGVLPFETPLVSFVAPDMPAASAGFQRGDVILALNGQIVDRRTFIEAIESSPPGVPLEIKVERNGRQTTLSAAPRVVGRFKDIVFRPGFDPETGENADAQPKVAYVAPDLAEKTGLQAGDVLVEIEGQPATAKRLAELELANPGKTLHAKVERRSLRKLSREFVSVSLPVAGVSAIGIKFTDKKIYYQVPPSRIVPEATRLCLQALHRTLMTVKALLTREVSPRDLGGPVMIYDVTTRAAEAGLVWFLRITAFININLGVFNLLPLPVLDGGVLVLQLIEFLRRKPLSPRFVERYQQVGLIIIIGLLLFVTWNDIGRMFGNVIP
jgi:regulator of sigma E protease